MKYSISANVNGNEAQIVKRHIDSPSLTGGMLFLDDLGIKCEDIDANGELVVTLTIKPVPGPR